MYNCEVFFSFVNQIKNMQNSKFNSFEFIENMCANIYEYILRNKIKKYLQILKRIFKSE